MSLPSLPKQFVIDAELYAKVYATFAWYDAMPDSSSDVFNPGDRFHENIRDMLDENMPAIPDGYYISCHNLTADQKWTVTIVEENNEENSTDIEVVPAQ